MYVHFGPYRVARLCLPIYLAIQTRHEKNVQRHGGSKRQLLHRDALFGWNLESDSGRALCPTDDAGVVWLPPGLHSVQHVWQAVIVLLSQVRPLLAVHRVHCGRRRRLVR